MRTLEQIAQALIDQGEVELFELDLVPTEFDYLKAHWEEFLALLPIFQRERVVLVEGDSLNEDRRYLLIAHLGTCPHV